MTEKQHTGIFAHRLIANPLEAKFAEAWRKECERGLLDHLLIRDEGDKISVRDETVAATIIQWLGSHVGQCFLKDVQK